MPCQGFLAFFPFIRLLFLLVPVLRFLFFSCFYCILLPHPVFGSFADACLYALELIRTRFNAE